MNIISLFDGMSCGQIALNRAGIEYDNYYAAEIDKHAVKVTQANYPNTIQLGSVTGWRDWGIDWSSIDLLIGGSPCQGFSFAGKQLAFDDPRSALFFEYVNILEHIKKFNPNIKFMLENVKMKKEHLNVITDLLDVEPVFINSALVSAQSRQRYYWTNWEFCQPDDRGILLGDIVESGVVDRDKSFCIDANYHKGSNLKSYAKGRRQIVYCSAIRGRYTTSGIKQRHEIRHDGKTICLTGVSKDNNLVYVDGFRKLTPTECERLQTVPEGYTDHVSKTQRYKMLGNGWTVDVIAHIFKSINTTKPPRVKQLSLF